MIVLDVNAAVALARGTEEGLALRELMMTGEEIIAPRLFLTELGNVAWKFVQAGKLERDAALSLLEQSASLVDRFIPDEELLVEALHVAIRHNHPVYDALYFVAARRNAATLFTFDKRLRLLCQVGDVDCLEMVQL